MDREYLVSRFEQTFPGATPAGVCQVPGRVNLIGEHVDYNGLPVLPMAIDRYVWAVFRPRADQSVHIASDDDAYTLTSFQAADSIDPGNAGDWSNYARAAVQAIRNETDLESTKGMDLYIAADLPAASGLSSSTALVVATAFAYLSCVDRAVADDTDRNTLAKLLADGERYVGTESGGMDHAAILLGQEHHALYIDFDPLHCEPIPIPDDCAIVVCNSGVVANKGGDAQAAYNRGPAYCGLIRAMVEHHAQQEFGDEIEFATLGEIWSGALCLTHSEAADLFEGAITKDRYSISEVATILEMAESEISERWLGNLVEPDDGLPLRAWSRHQYQERRRVELTRDALLSNDMKSAGQLLIDSHTSCAEGLGISTPELDALVDAAMASGAYGARLTGAGFGGCTVNLVPKREVESFCDAIWTRNYTAGPGADAGFASMEDAVFEVQAANGAEYP
jgi:galactokinase